MTDEEIDAMEAGRKVDADVHIALWPRHNIWQQAAGDGWLYCDGEHDKALACNYKQLPPYSTDIAAAWLVVEKLREQLWFVALDDVWPAAWQQGVRSEWHVARFLDGATTVEGMARSDALAICRAALKCCKAVADKKEDVVKTSVNA